MAWQSDLLGLVRGLGKVSSASSRVAPLEASRVWEGSLAKPAVHNVVKLVLEERKSEELSRNKKAKGIPVSRLVENLPLVIDGVRVYLGAIAGISPSSPSSKGFPPGDVERERGEEGEDVKWVVDQDVTSMDLLQMDLTDEAALRKRIYKRLTLKDSVEDVNIETE